MPQPEPGTSCSQPSCTLSGPWRCPCLIVVIAEKNVLHHQERREKQWAPCNSSPHKHDGPDTSHAAVLDPGDSPGNSLFPGPRSWLWSPSYPRDHRSVSIVDAHSLPPLNSAHCFSSSACSSRTVFSTLIHQTRTMTPKRLPRAPDSYTFCVSPPDTPQALLHAQAELVAPPSSFLSGVLYFVQTMQWVEAYPPNIHPSRTSERELIWNKRLGRCN